VPQRVIGTLRCAETMDPVTKEKKKHQREEKKHQKKRANHNKEKKKKNQTKKQNKPVFVDGGKKRIGFVEPTVA
jgi:hypothetical protein